MIKKNGIIFIYKQADLQSGSFFSYLLFQNTVNWFNAACSSFSPHIYD